MTKRYSIVLAVMALTFAFVVPAQAQDVATEGAAAATEKVEAHSDMMGEAGGCQCPCMQAMHEKMKEMSGAEGHAEGAAHAEGMDSDEGHAAMMAAHKEMMAGCKCMSGEGEGSMSCKMHGERGMGEMKGEGMQHRHGTKGEADADAETEAEG